MDSLLPDVGQSQTARDVQRGTMRVLHAAGFTPHIEVPLGNGRRADIVALNHSGDIAIVEVKSSLADYRADQKWQEYLAYADLFYFAVPATFPRGVLTEGPAGDAAVGIMVADRYGGDIIRFPARMKLNGQRRNSLTRRLATLAGQRLLRLADRHDHHMAQNRN